MSSTRLLIILSTGTGIGLIAGFVMHRSGYCLSGMFRDLFLFRETFMLRTLLLLVVVSMVVFEGGRRLGLLPFYPFPLLGSPSLTNLIGGGLFGVGMVMAGGCVVGTLYKMGAGSLTSAAAFLGLVAGSALFAEIQPGWASISASATFLKGTITLPQLLGVDPGLAVAAVSLPAGGLFLAWGRKGMWHRRNPVRGYLQPWAAALILAALGFLSYVTAGMPLGITTSYAKMAGYLESVFLPGHLEGLPYFQAVALNVRDPLTGFQLVGGGAPVFDSLAAIQLPLIGGIVAGSFLSALSVGEFRIYGNIPREQFALSFSGGAVLGLASRMAPGCNVWHLLGGLPIFAIPSLLFAAGLFPGAWLGGKIVSRIL
jgi:uncharacterized membrane protein YedE/YeeE